MKHVKKSAKKLALTSHTVRPLASVELARVAGGAPTEDHCGTNTCGSCLLSACYHPTIL